MCGIVGFVDLNGERAAKRDLIGRMTSRLAHRGPDADGIWQNESGTVNLGHRRLSIIDLSPSGAQPMISADGRYVISYNGEIYNFIDLRSQLEAAGLNFRGTSDTEVLLHAVAHWGVEATLRRLNGMFAFALWDGREQLLYLARDRFGEKPLYYGWHNQTFLFGSELKALHVHPSFRREIEPEAVSLFMRFNYVPWPYSIFRETWKLGPAQFLRIKLGVPPPKPSSYWSLAELIEERKLSTFDPRDPGLTSLLDTTLRRAVRMRMVSDVPLGAFLSGGIDSSTVVALMQAQSVRPVKTFTIGFWEGPYNEAKDAEQVARHLGTEHHEVYLSSRDCTDIISRLPDIYDEPFADSSQIPTTLVSEFTRRHVTVALSGDAGDELFGGYNRYFWSARVWPHLRRLPPSIRRHASNVIHRFSPAQLDRMFGFANPLLPSKFKVRGGGEKLHKLAMAMDARSGDELYRGFVSQWHNPEDVVLRGAEPPFLGEHFDAVPSSLDYIERMMYLDTVTYLPSDILCKVDRASMSTGLEARVPFLDLDTVRLAWSLPRATKIHDGVGKYPLRSVLQQYLPKKLFERPKMGFGIPIGDWLRGPLHEWAQESLSEGSLRNGGWFRPEVVHKQWMEHLSGKFSRQHSLWGILIFESWRKKWCS
jgi:asparagine synthase (glutamine-hydrolysing)